jgi:hypothetical protein
VDAEVCHNLICFPNQLLHFLDQLLDIVNHKYVVMHAKSCVASPLFDFFFLISQPIFKEKCKQGFSNKKGQGFSKQGFTNSNTYLIYVFIILPICII